MKRYNIWHFKKESKKYDVNIILNKSKFNIEDVIKKFTIKELIEAIGIENIEIFLRKEKLKKIKDRIKNG